MKKLSFFITITLLGFGFLISSCSEDEPDYFAPTVTITPADDTVSVSAGGTINYTIKVNSTDDLVSVKLTTEVGSNQQILLDSTMASGNKTFDVQFALNFPNDIPAGTVGKLTVFAATANASTIEESNIKVITSMSTYEGVELQAQADGPESADTKLSFYSANYNASYTYNQANGAEESSQIDMVFTHHSVFKTNAELSFQSPDSQNLVNMWNDFPLIPFAYDTSNKNETFFKELTNVDWDNLDYDGINDAIGDIGTDKKIRDIEEGDFIAFKTSTGKQGILKVVTTDIEHNPYNETIITFDVKMQK